jgi:hypothetical protein
MRLTPRLFVVVPTLLCCALILPAPARADEGMWLVNDFPSALVKERHGHAPDGAWLERARLGAARLANGCSASFVSADGLVMTNHHCIRSCLEELSTPARDLLESPFVARARTDELRCDKLELNQLVEITDVTERVLEATRGATGAGFAAKLKAHNAALESECSQGDPDRRCDVVALFSGARYHLHAYRRYRDVRMVMAPEFPMAAFGGDPDNFQFPRTGFDAAFVRVWDKDQPAKTPFHLRFAKAPAKADDLVYVVGHPGGTERLSTVAELELQRDVVLPWTLLRLAELRGRMDEWMRGDVDRTRRARSRLRSVENGLKALRGRLEALNELGLFDERRAAEAALIGQAPPHTRPGFEAIRGAMRDARGLWVDFRMKEGAEAFQSDLFGLARHLVRIRAEKQKPDAERLPEYTTAQLPFAEKQALSQAPIFLDLDEASLGWSLHRMRNLLGADHPFVKSVLGKESPEAMAKRVVTTTRVGDVAFRKAALEAKKLPDDPMLALALKVDAEARAARKAWEEKVDAVVKKNGELLAEARRVVQGTAGYPDATFTLRVSFGRVRPAEGEESAMTTVGDLFGRSTGAFPFALSPSWAAARGKIAARTPMNVATTNDIIGGNSGSPLLDKNGDVVGLVFDGNLPSLGGRYFYEPKKNRAVAVHASAIRAALQHVYGAQHILAELDR